MRLKSAYIEANVGTADFGAGGLRDDTTSTAAAFGGSSATSGLRAAVRDGQRGHLSVEGVETFVADAFGAEVDVLQGRLVRGTRRAHNTATRATMVASVARAICHSKCRDVRVN